MDQDEQVVKTESSDKEDEEEEEEEEEEEQKQKQKQEQEQKQKENKGEPVRTSSRKQDPVSDMVEMSSAHTIGETMSEVLDDAIKLHVRRSSRSKHHKNKTKHRKDKRTRKRRRHSKNGAETSIELERFECENAADARNGSAESRDSNNRETSVISELDAKLKLESFGIDTKDVVESPTTKTDHVDSVRFRNDVNSTTNSDTRCKVISVPGDSTRDTLENNRISKLHFNDNTALSLPKQAYKDLNKDVEYLLNPNATIESHASEVDAAEKENEASRAESHKGASKNVEDRKLKRRRKRPRHDAQIEENSAKDPSNALDETTLFKHRRKKHKHTSEHKSKKHHDVRKAPQDGIVVQEEARNACPPEAELSSTGRSAEAAQGAEDVDGPDDVASSPQRLAIKIKLCQECNSRHLQDACPLTMSQYAIADAISYEKWFNRHKENVEIMKAVMSEDPMSEGYGRLAYDGFESDDESPTSGEQCKAKPKVQKEEKQLLVEMDRPLYARDSLPECLDLKMTNTEHGVGIYAKNSIPIYAKFGPLIGIPVREMDIPDDFSMRHIWEVLSSFNNLIPLPPFITRSYDESNFY